MIELTYFNQVPATWRERGEKREERSPGRVGPGGDWFDLDPLARRAISEGEMVSCSEAAADSKRTSCWFNLHNTPDGWIGAVVGDDRGGNDRNDNDERNNSRAGGWDKDEAVMDKSGHSA